MFTYIYTKKTNTAEIHILTLAAVWVYLSKVCLASVCSPRPFELGWNSNIDSWPL